MVQRVIPPLPSRILPARCGPRAPARATVPGDTVARAAPIPNLPGRSMYTITFDDKAAVQALGRLTDFMSDLSPVMQEISEILIESTRTRMLAGETPEGTPFAPRSPATLAAYARSHDPYDALPLWRSGHLRNASLHASHGPDFLMVASSAKYSAVMQFGAAKGAFGTNRRGSPIPWGDIPARPFLGLSDADELMIVDVDGDYIAALVGGT